MIKISVSGLIADNTKQEYNIVLHVILHVWELPTLSTHTPHRLIWPHSLLSPPYKSHYVWGSLRMWMIKENLSLSNCAPYNQEN